MRWTDIGKAIRAVAKEKLGAELVGIDVAHIYAMTFGLGTACVAVAACLLIPTYYVNPERRQRLRADRLHHRRARRHGLGRRARSSAACSSAWSKACRGLFLGESLGQIGIFVIFIAVLLFRPSGLFGERA